MRSLLITIPSHRPARRRVVSAESCAGSGGSCACWKWRARSDVYQVPIDNLPGISMMLATRPKIPRWDDEHVTLGQLCRECETYLLGVRGYSPLTLNGYRLVWDQFRAYLRSQNKQDQIKEFTAAACIGFMTDLAARGVIVNTIISKLAARSTLAPHHS